jgi:hypothetical protein
MADWPGSSPAFDKADALHRALIGLMDYFGQAGVKTKAHLLQDKLFNLTWEKASDSGRHESLAHYLASWDINHVDGPNQRLLRANIWRDKLRPVLTDAELMATLAATRVHVRKDVRVTLEQRNAYLATLSEAVEYWDTHFA